MSTTPGDRTPEPDPFAPREPDAPTAPLPPTPAAPGGPTAQYPPSSVPGPGQRPPEPGAPQVPPYPAQAQPPYPGQPSPAGQPPYGAEPPYGAQPPYGAPSGGQAPYPGQQQYPGQQYPGQQYPGQQYPGQQYAGQQSPGQQPYGDPATYGGPPADPYGAYGQGPYGQAPGTYPGAAGYGQPTPPVDGMAIGSFVTSLGGLLFTAGLASPVGLVLGIVSLRRIKRTGKSGNGWAVSGIVIGAIGTLTLLAVLAFGLVLYAAYREDPDAWNRTWDEFERQYDEGGSGTFGDTSGTDHYTLRDDLAAGDCLQEYPLTYDLSDAVVVDCGTAHDTEVIGTVALTGPVYSWDDVTWEEAVETCAASVEAAAPGLLDAAGYADVFTPDPDDFGGPGGDVAICVYASDGAGLTGSVVTGDVLVGAGEVQS